MFGATAASVYTSDGTTSQTNDATIGSTVAAVADLGLTAGGFTSASTAQSELTKINTAIGTVATDHGTAGADINTLQSVSNVMSTESTNTLSAENDVTATDYGTATSNMSKEQILMQTGIAALAQAQQSQGLITKLLQ